MLQKVSISNKLFIKESRMCVCVCVCVWRFNNI